MPEVFDIIELCGLKNVFLGAGVLMQQFKLLLGIPTESQSQLPNFLPTPLGASS